MEYSKNIKIPEGMRMLRLNEFIELLNNYYKVFWGKDAFDEWIEQPLKIIKDKFPFTNIYGSAVDDYYDRLKFYGYFVDNDWCHAFGVRFCRELK